MKCHCIVMMHIQQVVTASHLCRPHGTVTRTTYGMIGRMLALDV